MCQIPIFRRNFLTSWFSSSSFFKLSKWLMDGSFMVFFKTSLQCKWGLYHFGVLRETSNVEFRKIENTRLSLVSSHSFFNKNLTSNKRRSLICYLNLLSSSKTICHLVHQGNQSTSSLPMIFWHFVSPYLLFCSF